ncbi:auxin efflux carrier [Trametes versicolor FP-101664 SS1]|uniref:auxin efflux carrier n=1 Tax=Trametes versicolor (strain FP-101664) TaxID=717944 RepID=UPI0004624028|nr:auxin efflux carrier [Trametes versicolor FP-101664 SS1]EIW61418.1 auxin efflux carrier [Trametes versicolor FP-101664 SS1]
MASAAFLIYSGIMPLIKTFISIICGYVLARMGLFPPAAAQGASQVTMNVSLPALIFANIVPAFTPSNVGAIGPLFLIAFFYQAFGFLAGFIIREFCYVPRNFWQGIIVLTGMSNWGNLPNAVVISVTQQAPFDPSVDEALGVSYVSIFIVCYHITFWMLGAAHSLSWDYRPGVPQGEATERRLKWHEKPFGALVARYILHREYPPSQVEAPEKDEEAWAEKEKGKDVVESVEPSVTELDVQVLNADLPETDPDVQLARRTSRLSTAAPPAPNTRLPPSASTSALPPVPPPTRAHSIRSAADAQSLAQGSDTDTLHPASFKHRVIRVFRPLAALITPVTITLAISLPIALVQPLKALFVDVSDIGGPSWKGPDGRPPLAFLIDTAQFMGNIAVPLALVLLGASFARLQTPRPLSRLPLMAMFLTTITKMAILPVIGVFLVQAMTNAGLIDKSAKAERFVAMFLSGTPTAVNQMIVSSLYSPDGNVDTLSVSLLVILRCDGLLTS